MASGWAASSSSREVSLAGLGPPASLGSVRRHRRGTRSQEATTLSKLTGERPLRGVTPDSLLALHEAGYRAVRERLGPGRVLDVGCGEGLAWPWLAGDGRQVVGVDYALSALRQAALRRGPVANGASAGDSPAALAASEASKLCFGDGTFDWAVSSHLIEHFADPEDHVSELARVLRRQGATFVLTPNAPADFENPFHLRLFLPDDLAKLLGRHFSRVWVGGLQGDEAATADFARRRARAARLLRLDLFDLRHRLPRSWYVGAYTRALPLAYRLLASGDAGGASGITFDSFFVTDAIDDSTLVLLAAAAEPRRKDG
jgi:SAM-dependent methyltransferase